MIHLGYEFVKLPSGMMSSRTGNVITYESLWEEAIARAMSETKKRHVGWSKKKVKEVAEKIVVGAIKFEMVKVGKEQKITFDVNRALSFDGFTAAYLQYTHARVCSILKKVGVKKINVSSLDKLKEKWEYSLSLELGKFPEVIKQASALYNPAILADYLYSLAKIFSDFYRDVRVLGAGREIVAARLALLSAVKIVLAKGLDLLGIAAPDKM
jgi:arginyl-tRNA synthetase